MITVLYLSPINRPSVLPAGPAPARLTVDGRKLADIKAVLAAGPSLHGPVAQANCAARDVVVERLAAGFGEKLAGAGLRNSTSIFEVWMSEEKGTWTILLTTADGQSCVMASGTHWRGADPVEPEGVSG